ncbi:hypothetical protein ABID82_007195 [Methylobacterium sp. PvP062]|uniref:Uncharacterized protein n=1 Tax=Methylobacterium radiotolerans TaxID=31998 RepID=A0ABV2NQ24_9HYPH|nr:MULTISPECIES: hypothetical protein [unclassified Methylobacterium]MBP2494684.1 hypothetical protein [Methylobacterium sp. PvP105]MBP2505445.1 hypothetical protein [Methylobacterium sp. PvP109]MCX7336348.1 hypothetical protein [Hyphomicrobiales bacterium]
MTVPELETLLKSLLKGEFSSLTISFNDSNAPNYSTVQKHAEGWPDWDNHTDWVSDEERARAIETNSWWNVHWYPDTPVGFCSISASTLPALIAGLCALGDGKSVE